MYGDIGTDFRTYLNPCRSTRGYIFKTSLTSNVGSMIQARISIIKPGCRHNKSKESQEDDARNKVRRYVMRKHRKQNMESQKLVE